MTQILPLMDVNCPYAKQKFNPDPTSLFMSLPKFWKMILVPSS